MRCHGDYLKLEMFGTLFIWGRHLSKEYFSHENVSALKRDIQKTKGKIWSFWTKQHILYWKNNLQLVHQYQEDSDNRNISLLYRTLKELWANSEFLVVNDAISVLIKGNCLVKGVDMTYTLTLNFTLFKCSRKIYALIDSIRSHILVIAEKKG